MELSKMTMEIFSKLEQQWLLSQTIVNNDTKKTKILTIDGGGISATTAGAFLISLESLIRSKTGDNTTRIVDFFDIIAGTGIGGVLAVLITAADATTGRPMFTAAEAVSFLSENRGKMFKSRRSGVLRRRDRRRCSAESLARVFKQALGNMTLKDTCKPLLVPCYDTVTSSPFVFSRAAAASASEFTTVDFELWKVCSAAVATPALFEPVEITSVDGKTGCLAIDGGLVMNNPAGAAVTHVLHNKVDFPLVNGVEDLLVMSIGNGRGSSEKWSGDSKKMAECVVDVAANALSETIDQMLGNAFSSNRHDYVRIQANGFDGSLMTMEKALQERGIESLAFGGKRLLAETNVERIESFVQRLLPVQSKNSLPPSPYKSLSPLLDGR